jgi:hypothetical protein
MWTRNPFFSSISVTYFQDFLYKPADFPTIIVLWGRIFSVSHLATYVTDGPVLSQTHTIGAAANAMT